MIEHREDSVKAANEAAAAAKDLEAIASITFVSLVEAGQIETAAAAQHPAHFAAWACPAKYKAGQIRRHGEKLYRCLSDHTSQESWMPDAAPSLWVAISDPAEEWPAWSQPHGKYDAYKLGDKVSHNGTHWTCTQTDEAGCNTWEPGVYGWTEAT